MIQKFSFVVIIFVLFFTGRLCLAAGLFFDAEASNKKFNETFSFSVKPGPNNVTFNFIVEDLDLPVENQVFKLEYRTAENEIGFVTATLTIRDKYTEILENNNFDVGEKDKEGNKTDLGPSSSSELFVCFGDDDPSQLMSSEGDASGEEVKKKVIVAKFTANFNCPSSEVQVEARLSTLPFPRIEMNREYKLNLKPGQLNLFHVDFASSQNQFPNDTIYFVTKLFSSSLSCKTVLVDPAPRCPSRNPSTKTWTSAWNRKNQFRVERNDSMYANGFVVGVTLGGDQDQAPCAPRVHQKYHEKEEEEDTFLTIFPYQPKNLTSYEIALAKNYSMFSSVLMILLIASCLGIMACLVFHRSPESNIRGLILDGMIMSSGRSKGLQY